MRNRLHEGVLLLGLGLGLAGGAGADEPRDRPLLQAEGTSGESGSPLPEDAAGGRWRSSTRLGKAPAQKPPEELPPPPAVEAEEALPPGFAPARPAAKMRYQGVAPGRAELPPHPPKLPLGKGPQRLTWPGFQLRDGRPTLFLQLSGPVEYSVSQRPGEVHVTLHDTVVPLRNNLRPLLVQDFKTPVTQVRFERKKNTVTAVVTVKGSVAHTERMESAENGYQMLLVQFSPMPVEGKEPSAEAPKAEPAKPEARPEAKTEAKTEAQVPEPPSPEKPAAAAAQAPR